jgi:hypothetical protein
MFGSPQWFRPKQIGWGLVPVTWQGWAYTAGWLGTIVLPFLLLVERHQPLEATAWMGLALGALVYDVWKILRASQSPGGAAGRASASKREDNVLYIMDSQPGQAVATRNFNLHVRR